VWAATTDQMKKGYNHILFVGARRHWCNAMSDIMQTWGISGYLTMHGGKEITSDIDTLTDKNKDRKTVVIKVECPSLTDTVNPHITIFPSYESYVRSTGQ